MRYRPDDERPAAGTRPGPWRALDVITANGKPTGRVKPRAEVHRDGDWHRAIHVWVAGVDGRGAPFLTAPAPLAPQGHLAESLRRDRGRALPRGRKAGRNAA